MQVKKIELFGKYIIVSFILSGLLVSSSTGMLLNHPGSDTMRTIKMNTLPPPATIDMSLEYAMSRRMSIREFTGDPVTDVDLSTILWAAYGTRDDNNKTVYDIGGEYVVVIYVLTADAVYKYDSDNHSLLVFREGDYRDEVGWQYSAPIQLALATRTDINEEFLRCVQVGAVYQNIQFAVNALELGTVVTGEVPSPIRHIGLPDNEEGKIVMPIGHPEFSYNFKYRPLWLSFLPKMKESTMSLTAALNSRHVSSSLTSQVAEEEMYQLLWSSYGFSYYLDRSQQELNSVKRHRTVPSAHAYYPFETYALTESEIFYFNHNILVEFNRIPIDFIGIPIFPLSRDIAQGDFRETISQISGDTVSSSKCSFILLLNIEKTRPAGTDDFSGEHMRWLWHLEAGSMIHNVMLQATTLGLHTNVFPIVDDEGLLEVLELDGEFDPMYIISIG